MNADYTGYYVLYGGILLIASIITLLGWLGRRHEQRERDSKSR